MKKISRKNFIHFSARTAVSFPLLNLSFAAGTSLETGHEKVTEETHIFRFLQINDLHFQSERSRYSYPSSHRVGSTYQEANLRALWLLEALKSDPSLAEIDFILGIGDLVHGETLEAISYDLEYFSSHFYKKLPVPLYPAMGNHENVQREGDAAYEEPYKQLFGNDKINYSFTHKGVHFIVFNNSGSGSIQDIDLLNYRIESLESLLKEHPLLPKIICCHIPLMPIREREVLSKSFGFSSYYSQEQAVLELINQYQDKVLAVLSGHLHLSGMIIADGIHHIVLSGLASYPHDFAIYSVYANRLEVTLRQVPSDLLVPATNIHGAKRFGFDYVDPLHPDYTSYLMGTPEERRFTIPLKV